jgi:hypothetical protein
MNNLSESIRKCSWPKLRYYPGTSLERLRKTKKNIRLDRRVAVLRFESRKPRTRRRGAEHLAVTYGLRMEKTDRVYRPVLKSTLNYQRV